MFSLINLATFSVPFCINLGASLDANLVTPLFNKNNAPTPAAKVPIKDINGCSLSNLRAFGEFSTSFLLAKPKVSIAAKPAVQRAATFNPLAARLAMPVTSLENIFDFPFVNTAAFKPAATGAA